ncbi:hypothetical protein NLX83_03825 [Allokutzneria sp. A3M-2-11 16]|uniref:DUF7192 family protein n=1 Tax=Allokutzneria sp. A3M-2-11 16 TaxID=2962043 RepID=UPI0020B660E8|nr:hypothetical protein [Allokutzneria sp. A3M-2-11 16]MCP3798381.1 hypothetical protein [Allokutzneria sp. A3M-2-11 16]
MSGFVLSPMLSWQEFLDAATADPSITIGKSRGYATEWAGATWEEAVRLGRDGWAVALRESDFTVGQLRERAGLGSTVTVLEPAWDVTGSEVDIGAYLAGVPECMVDAVPRQISRRGKVITFVIPMSYSAKVRHECIINRGLALATLCAAIIEAGHSVEIWSGDAGFVDQGARTRYSAVVRVISAGEPLDIGRLIFATAHPAMCRRLALGLWDAQPTKIALAMRAAEYGWPPFECRADDLPDGITDPYVFPYLAEDDTQWNDLDTALGWCHRMFVDLGLIEE